MCLSTYFDKFRKYCEGLLNKMEKYYLEILDYVAQCLFCDIKIFSIFSSKWAILKWRITVNKVESSNNIVESTIILLNFRHMNARLTRLFFIIGNIDFHFYLSPRGFLKMY